MKLDISKDSVSGAAPNGELILNKNNIKTNVLVNNGETVILGGVFEQTTLNSQTKVPFLGIYRELDAYLGKIRNLMISKSY